MAVLFSEVTLSADNNEAYLYGERETSKATPKKVAYFKMRAEADVEFLHGYCNNIKDINFTIPRSSDELYDVGVKL